MKAESRRQFIKTAALGTAACACACGSAPVAFAASGKTERTFALFTKHLIGLPPERLADQLAAIGITAIEAPVRPKGHVEPGRVEEDLPKFVETLKTRGIEIPIIASGINAVTPAQHTEQVLRTARSLGIRRYRMDWYSYDLTKPLWPQLDALKPRLRELTALSHEIGILPCYQNHSGGRMIGGPVWDMAMLMRDFQPDDLAWSFDIMHATIEGGTSWPIEVQLVKDRIGAAYFKDFRWEGRQHRPTPLGEGIIDRNFIATLKKDNFAGPISLHIEYIEGRIEDSDYLKRALEATKRDMETLKSWWG
jgi:sugar phosphate isomerase/epimerase